MALEFCELINHVEYMKDPIIEAVLNTSKIIFDKVNEFDNLLMKY